jgi:DnaK suppressor protein
MARKEALLRLHQSLLARREALRKALAGDLSLLEEQGGLGRGDSVDAATDTAQDEISSQLAQLESRELVQIERALKRMREGVYGRCEHCDGKIPMARLNALPYSTTCIACQREKERLGDSGDGEEGWDRVQDSEGSDRDVSFNDIQLDLSESGR